MATASAAQAVARADRVAVLGCGGSGKTYVSAALASHGDLPLTHLDALFYTSDWTPVPAGDFADAQQRAVAGDRWVIDGNYVSTLSTRAARADAVVLLDLHPVVCLWGVISRRVRHRAGQDSESGLYNRVTWNFVKYVLTYRRRILPRVLEALDTAPRQVSVLVMKRRRDVRHFKRLSLR